VPSPDALHRWAYRPKTGRYRRRADDVKQLVQSVVCPTARLCRQTLAAELGGLEAAARNGTAVCSCGGSPWANLPRPLRSTAGSYAQPTRPHLRPPKEADVKAGREPFALALAEALERDQIGRGIESQASTMSDGSGSGLIPARGSWTTCHFSGRVQIARDAQGIGGWDAVDPSHRSFGLRRRLARAGFARAAQVSQQGG
jgi:hypothetical protein